MILYSPIQFRNLELQNRWVMSPMCMYSCENGVANDFHLVHYASRAQGGTGLLIVELYLMFKYARLGPTVLTEQVH